MLRRYLEEQARAWEALGAPCYLEKFVLAVADCEANEAISLPELGTPKECFRNAGTLVLEFPEVYDYVEGYFISDKLPIAIHHAWLWDKRTNQVVETTLKLDGRESYEYLGKRFNDDYAKFLSDWGNWCLLDSDIHLNVDLMTALAPEVFDETKH